MHTQYEVWLRPNRRALGTTLAAALVVTAAGASLAALGAAWGWWAIAIGVVVIIGGIWFSLSLIYQMTLPRLAYSSGELLVYLESAAPIRVPIDIVELFFAGQSGSTLPATDNVPSKSRTVVVRLAEAATDWHDRPVKPNWGEWREAYIIVRGTWCEPLTPEVFKFLNRRLREVQRERAGASEAG
jgi:hypothetical protein